MKRLALLLAVFALLVAGATTATAGNQPSDEITIQEITFENEGDTIYGTFTMPANVRRNVPAVLMLHGFTGDRNEGPIFEPDFTFEEFMYERTARIFAEDGIATLRIDFRGSGESVDLIGFEETTFSGQVSDAYAGVEWLDDQQKIGRIGILGLSQGGLVGTITAESHRRVGSLALWSPVASPVDTYKTVLGADCVAEGLSEISASCLLPWGAEVTLNQAFFEELYTTDPIAAVSHFDKPLQVVVGERDDVVTPQPQYGQTYMTYHDGYEELVVLDGDHVFDVFAGNGVGVLDDAINASADWFTETLSNNRRR